MSETRSPRRYYLLQRIEQMQLGESALAGVWRWKQEQQPATLLPTDFPYLERIGPVGYTTIEDLNGADTRELQRTAGLFLTEAQAVLAAVAPLLPPSAAQLEPTPGPLVIGGG